MSKTFIPPRTAQTEFKDGKHIPLEDPPPTIPSVSWRVEGPLGEAEIWVIRNPGGSTTVRVRYRRSGSSVWIGEESDQSSFSDALDTAAAFASKLIRERLI